MLKAVANDESTHHVQVCTLCSCYCVTILGLPPPWYKSRSYRSRSVRVGSQIFQLSNEENGRCLHPLAYVLALVINAKHCCDRGVRNC